MDTFSHREQAKLSFQCLFTAFFMPKHYQTYHCTSGGLHTGWHCCRYTLDKILRTLSKHGKLAAAEVERLERNVALLVTTQDVRKKTRLGEPQYKLDLASLGRTVQISSTQGLMDILAQIQGDVVRECTPDKHAVMISVDPHTFHKEVLDVVQREGPSFGSASLNLPPTEGTSQQTVLVEYSSPNIAKPFHAGHLRSTIIGHFTANLYQHLGHTVHRVNYLGDWGTQFGLLALGFQRYGDETSLKEDPLLHLFKVYVEINQKVEEEKQSKSNNTYQQGLQLFTKLEQGDPEMLKLWKQFRELSLEEYQKMYQVKDIQWIPIR
ncbi:hypothetical protein V1264_001173 [Littorina saxatilis]|uniref:Probable arginine--tRNA ligase, mitochondrial n=1 Tax=Littorina saxatilis TaxID=31220 RepID=A0AAN9C6F4_9CAEN